MSFTTKSPSVPVVVMRRSATGMPCTRTACGQHRRFIREHVGTSVDEALVAHQPLAPRIVGVAERRRGHRAERIDQRPRQERHRVRRIAGVHIAAARLRRRIERQREVCAEVERLRLLRAALLARLRPGVEAFEALLAGVVDGDARQLDVRPAAQMLIQERQQDLAAIVQRRVFAPASSGRARRRRDSPGCDSTVRAPASCWLRDPPPSARATHGSHPTCLPGPTDPASTASAPSTAARR